MGFGHHEKPPFGGIFLIFFHPPKADLKKCWILPILKDGSIFCFRDFPQSVSNKKGYPSFDLKQKELLKGCRFRFELENWIPNSQKQKKTGTFLFPKGSRGALFRWLPHVCTSCSYNRLVGNLQLQRQWHGDTFKPTDNMLTSCRKCAICASGLAKTAKWLACDERRGRISIADNC